MFDWGVRGSVRRVRDRWLARLVILRVVRKGNKMWAGASMVVVIVINAAAATISHAGARG